MRLQNCLLVVIATGTSLFMASCAGGVQFNPSNFNENVGDELRNRAVLASAGSYRSNLGGLMGLVLKVEDTPGRDQKVFDALNIVGQELPPTSSIQIELKPFKWYESKVTGGMQVQGSYLTAAASISGDGMRDVLITDEAVVYVKAADIPWHTLKNMSVPLNTKLFYVRGAILSSLIYKTYTKVDANATVSGGAFGANGKVFASNEGFSQDIKIALDVIAITSTLRDDLNRAGHGAGSGTLGTPTGSFDATHFLKSHQEKTSALNKATFDGATFR
jgi:hypothetical protein